mmetsp:Transcript_5847/g.25900  ORF Transcript_5847/g.25900 Transcript_5847/m.25900 type:complete len:279 (-) Transcript_5847:394-1230(-)
MSRIVVGLTYGFIAHARCMLTMWSTAVDASGAAVSRTLWYHRACILATSMSTGAFENPTSPRFARTSRRSRVVHARSMFVTRRLRTWSRPSVVLAARMKRRKPPGGSGASHSPLRYPASLAATWSLHAISTNSSPGTCAIVYGTPSVASAVKPFWRKPIGSSDGGWYRQVTERATGSICAVFRHSHTLFWSLMPVFSWERSMYPTSLPVVPSLESHTHVICRILCLPLESSCARLSAALSALARSFAASLSALAATFSAALRAPVPCRASPCPSGSSR